MTNISKEKNLQYYLELPYTTTLRKDEDGDFVAKIVELEGCSAHGSDASEALANLDEAKSLWIEDALDADDRIPLPENDLQQLPSGKWLQRVPRSLHKKLAARAEREGVSLNQLVTSLLSESVGLGEGAERTTDSMRELFGDIQKMWSSSASKHWDVSLPPIEADCKNWPDMATKKLGVRVFYSSNARISRHWGLSDEITHQILDWFPTSVVIKPEAFKQHAKKSEKASSGD